MAQTKFVKKNFKGIVLVAPASHDILKLQKTIAWLSRNDAVALRRIGRYVKIIAVHPKKSYDNEFFPDDRTWIFQRGTLYKSSSCYLASLIVHEAYHGAQFAHGLRPKRFSLEPAAYRAQIRFLKKHRDERAARHVNELLKQKHWRTNYIIYRHGHVQSSPSLASYALAVKTFLGAQAAP